MKFPKFFNVAALSFGLLSFQAFAQEAGAAPSSGKSMMLQVPMLLALFALFYFGIIRPQRNQAKQHSEFVSKLSRGDEVITSSGIIGTIRGLTDKVVTLEIAPSTEIKILKSQVQSKLKDTLNAPTAESKA